MVVKNRLKEILDERGIKQTWLAEKIGLHRGTLNNIISNKYSTTTEMGLKIANALNMKFEDIFYLGEDEK